MRRAWCGTIEPVTSRLLSCTVRGCGLPLTRSDVSLTCAAGHAFDVARSGYINLLQVLDRRSAAPGDAPAATDARARLLAAGIGVPILDAMVARAATLLPPMGGRVADLGCGTGELLDRLSRAATIDGVGLDLSTTALTRAARTCPSQTWVVANADRRLPFQDGALDLVLSLNARRNPEECARVLTSGGHLVIGLPAADDLLELRAAVQGAGVVRDRWDAVVASHAEAFTLTGRETLRVVQHIEGAALQDLLLATYRGSRHSAAPQVLALPALDLTLAMDFLVFARR